ncbi:hypothetical protein D3C78_1906070 [compost metagenome]
MIRLIQNAFTILIIEIGPSEQNAQLFNSNFRKNKQMAQIGQQPLVKKLRRLFALISYKLG